MFNLNRLITVLNSIREIKYYFQKNYNFKFLKHFVINPASITHRKTLNFDAKQVLSHISYYQNHLGDCKLMISQDLPKVKKI